MTKIPTSEQLKRSRHVRKAKGIIGSRTVQTTRKLEIVEKRRRKKKNYDSVYEGYIRQTHKTIPTRVYDHRRVYFKSDIQKVE